MHRKMLIGVLEPKKHYTGYCELCEELWPCTTIRDKDQWYWQGVK